MTRFDAKSEPKSGALTAVIETESDVAAVGRSATTPLHERTAYGEVDVADWHRIAAADDFKALLASKVRFIGRATVFFIAYYFALPVLVGCARDLMQTRVMGVVNLAYLFALSQFFMAWALAWLYLRQAARYDTMAKQIIARAVKGR